MNHFFQYDQIDMLIETIRSDTKTNKLLVIDYYSKTNKLIIKNITFRNLLKENKKYGLTVFWSVCELNDIKIKMYWNCLHELYYDYIYLDRVDLCSKIKSTYELVDPNQFDFEFYKMLNNCVDFSDCYIKIKYVQSQYGHNSFKYIDIVKV